MGNVLAQPARFQNGSCHDSLLQEHANMQMQPHEVSDIQEKFEGVKDMSPYSDFCFWIFLFSCRKASLACLN